MRWDIFCRVIDNHGDLGVCWRLAADLGSRGETVRLWIDDPLALAWMAPTGAPGVSVIRWVDPLPALTPGEVVVEAFGCDPPPGFVERMALTAPVWVNLEYLSAETYVERSHGLPSPQQHGPGAGLTKWFFYPGFTAATGGLLRGSDALAGPTSLAEFGIAAQPGERVVSLFAYADAPFDALLARLQQRPTLLLLAAGASQAPALTSLAAAAKAGSAVRALALPWLDQPGYDRLLRCCDLNLARGEDSIVRAMWAGRPFIWHIYGQHDGAHAAKLQALLAYLLADADAGLAEAVTQTWLAWNGLGEWPARLPADAAWRALCGAWRDKLVRQADLTTQLMRFVAAKR